MTYWWRHKLLMNTLANYCTISKAKAITECIFILELFLIVSRGVSVIFSAFLSVNKWISAIKRAMLEIAIKRLLAVLENSWGELKV